MSSVSESVRKMLSEYVFEVDNSDLTCILCKKIMINAYQSVCGCNYCKGCITDYITGEMKYCVGDKEECKEEYLVLDENVMLCPRINRKIFKLKIRCPNQFCECETELSQLEVHLEGCTQKQVSCPFLNMGCKNERGSKNEVINHLHKEEWIHANMLSEFVEITKNEIKYFKEVQMKDIIDEILILKQSLDNKKNMIEFQSRDFENVKEELFRDREEIIQLKDIIELIKNREIIDLKATLDIKEMAIVEMKRQMEEQRIKIEGLEHDVLSKEREMGVIRGELEMIREEKSMMEKQFEKMDARGKMEDQKKRMDDLKTSQEYIEREIRSVIKRVKDSRIYDEKEFMWRIDNFSKMKDEPWRRIILWRHSYKFYIEVWCLGDDFGFTCFIMKGEFDDRLVWPMKHKIRLSLMNQDTMEVHKYEEYGYDTSGDKSAFEKPSARWNNSFADYSLMSVKDIRCTPVVLTQDSLILSFTIDPQ